MKMPRGRLQPLAMEKLPSMYNSVQFHTGKDANLGWRFEYPIKRGLLILFVDPITFDVKI